MNEDSINGSKVKISTPLDIWAKDLIDTTVKKTVKTCMEEYMIDMPAKCSIGRDVKRLALKFYVLVAFLGGVGVLNVVSIFLK